MKFKPKIFLVVDWHHFFYEFFEPLIQSFGESLDVSVVINDLDPEHTNLIIKRCNNLKNVNNIHVVKLYGSGILNSLKAIHNLWNIAGYTGLWCFPFLSESSIRLLSQKIKLSGGRSIMLQNSLLHPSVWSNEKSNIVIEQKNPPKIFRFNKYTNYTRFLYKILKKTLSNLIFGMIISPIFIGQFFFKTKSSKLDYLVDSTDCAMVFSDREKKLFQDLYGSKNIKVVRLPSFNRGKKTEGNGILIAIPGPFIKDFEKNLDDFFIIARDIISVNKPNIIMIRFHPDESDQIKNIMLKKIEHFFKGSHIENVTGKPLFTILDKTNILISRPSNLIALTRQYSKYIAILGVLKSGFEDLLATNVQCRDLPDVCWIEKTEDMNFEYINKKKYKIENEVKSDLSSELIEMAKNLSLNKSLIH